MPLPGHVLALAESHGCFSGCYDWGDDLLLSNDPAAPPEPAITAQCADCLSYVVGSLSKLLPKGMIPAGLARELTEHMRQTRGYDFAFSGYHTEANGFWLSAAYYASCGLFLLNGDRSRAISTAEVDLLVTAFRTGIANPSHPQMTDVAQYTCETVYLDLSTPLGPVTGKQDVLSASQCSRQRKPSFHQVTLAEFLPIARAPRATTPASINGPATGPQASAAPPSPRDVGDVCDVCGDTVRERKLFSSTYIGCRCG